MMFNRLTIISCICLAGNTCLYAQQKWVNADNLYGPLPKGIHVYKSTTPLDDKPNIAFYVIADLENHNLDFTTDTTYRRRLTPQKFYEKNGNPIVVVNGTFFSFETNQNLNVVVKDGNLVAHNVRKVRSRAWDTTSVFKDEKISRGVIGISSKRKADVAWVTSDSSSIYPDAFQTVWTDTSRRYSKRWIMKTAIGGGPVLIQNGKISISNEEEKMFAGKAINDKHPRTCMGYTKDNKLIIMVIQGRDSAIAEGATLLQQAKMLLELGCLEALNLDGGGSSCMLINGKETIKPSDKGQQRPVPAVFYYPTYKLGVRYEMRKVRCEMLNH